jgi:hypothetical protein
MPGLAPGSERWQIVFTAEEVAEIDAERGRQNRASYVRRLIKEARAARHRPVEEETPAPARARPRCVVKGAAETLAKVEREVAAKRAEEATEAEAA